jgi:Flp pilus assembly protein TadD
VALRGDSPHIEFVRLLGASLFLQDRFQEAIEPFREVFQKARTAGAGYHLGHCHLAVGDPKTASAVLEQVVREFPQMAQAHNLLGVSLAQQSRHREALAHFTFAIERSPQDAEAHNDLLFRKGDSANSRRSAGPQQPRKCAFQIASKR